MKILIRYTKLTERSSMKFFTGCFLQGFEVLRLLGCQRQLLWVGCRGGRLGRATGDGGFCSSAPAAAMAALPVYG
jgi:hypothetical protein